MKGVVLCEYTGVLSAAMRAAGHECYSCDLLPTEGDSTWHIQRDAVEVAFSFPWDFAFMHPPCTHTATSGNSSRSLKQETGEEAAALDFILRLWGAPIKHKMLEQPKSITGRVLGRHTQEIHPWWFGHPERKTTWLWLSELPRLVPTHRVEPTEESVYLMKPSANRGLERSRPFQGIVNAMVNQWSDYMADPYELSPKFKLGRRPRPA